MSKSSRVGRLLLLIGVGLVIGLSVYNWNARRVVGNELPMPFGIGVSVVLTGSMEPELSANDVIFVKKADDYSVGDVVVYSTGGSLTVHRIIFIEGDEVITKGDANDAEDKPINRSTIIGRVAWSVPYVGAVVRVLKTLPGTLLILVIAGYFIYRSWQKEKLAGDSEIEKIKEEIRQLKGE